MRHALIMAGGAGTRLWPLSRRERPKQLLRLFGGKSLLRLAYERVSGLCDAANTWVITSQSYLDQAADELPELPAANFIGEPVGRDTANAIGLAAHLIATRDPNATMAIFTADHLINPVDRFHAALRVGLDAAETRPDSLVTFGIRPTEPHTGYGYVETGEPVSPGVQRAVAFREKPSHALAAEYAVSGRHLWNSGMFAWRAGAIIAALERHLPQNAGTLASIAADWHTSRRAAAEAAFTRLPRVSIDYAVLEHAESVLVVAMDVDWRDVGSWTALAAAHQPDAGGNRVLADRALLVDSSGSVVVSEDEHLIALLGVRDVVVVRSGDATLICHTSQVERLKELAAERQARFGELYE
jgi:mannose-1-phosphate guanylyltransferase